MIMPMSTLVSLPRPSAHATSVLGGQVRDAMRSIERGRATDVVDREGDVFVGVGNEDERRGRATEREERRGRSLVR